MADATDEALFLGAAMLLAQRVEYLLYGIVSHLSHLPEAQAEKRFKKLKPDVFLSGDTASMKATLGQIVHQFGDVLHISTQDLLVFCENRNLIAHNFIRELHFGSRGRPARTDALNFLKNFIDEAQRFYDILYGLFLNMMQAAATKEGREAEVANVMKGNKKYINAYLLQFIKHMQK